MTIYSNGIESFKYFFGGITYGAAGIGAMLLMSLPVNTHLVKDAPAKHGISGSESSRSGGLAIASVVIVYITGLSVMSPYTPDLAKGGSIFYLWGAVFFCCLLGLAEDLKPDFLTPLLWLGLKFVFLGVYSG
jgi:hypothetical protein